MHQPASLSRTVLQRLAMLAALLAFASLAGGCTTTLVLMYVHEKITEGMPPACHKLDTVERALSPRCGNFVPGSLDAQHVAHSRMPLCPVTEATRYPRLWPVLPELLAKGATLDGCAVPPLVALAQTDPCPDFTQAPAEVLSALRRVAEDPRSVHHDAMRVLSCPHARAAGLHTALDRWLSAGWLPPRTLPFGPLSALHPEHLQSPFARALEAQGHTARAGLGGYHGHLDTGFEAALHRGHWAALDWWLTRVPELANKVPPRDGRQLPWVPLARVVGPRFIDDPAQQEAAARFLLARGARPAQKLPHDPGLTVAAYARRLQSPLAALLEGDEAVKVAGQHAEAAAPLAPAVK